MGIGNWETQNGEGWGKKGKDIGGDWETQNGEEWGKKGKEKKKNIRK